jgi:hypothetical protein
LIISNLNTVEPRSAMSGVQFGSRRNLPSLWQVFQNKSVNHWKSTKTRFW